MPATTSINLRISDREKVFVDPAAIAWGKSRTAFILENTLRLAEEVILEQTPFTLDSEMWNKLQATLNNPPSEEQVRGLCKLFTIETPVGNGRWSKQILDTGY